VNVNQTNNTPTILPGYVIKLPAGRHLAEAPPSPPRTIEHADEG
jgi:hypothetical protein